MTEGTKSYINDAFLGKAISAYVKAQRDRAQMTNQDICAKLEECFGIVQTSDNLKNKINRGNFGAQLLMMIVSVLGVEVIDIKEINRLYESARKGEL